MWPLFWNYTSERLTGRGSTSRRSVPDRRSEGLGVSEKEGGPSLQIHEYNIDTGESYPFFFSRMSDHIYNFKLL